MSVSVGQFRSVSLMLDNSPEWRGGGSGGGGAVGGGGGGWGVGGG